jgi:SAM-dependent methyltransferase
VSQVKHSFGAYSDSSKGEGHPVMFGTPPVARHFDPFPDGGGYPKGFIEFAMKEMGCTDASTILHLCSGSMVTGVRVDIRPERKPDIVADCRNVPLPDESFDFIMADPPYSEEYARNLYGTEKHYPAPGAIAKEACRLLRPGGKFGLLHFQVPMLRKPMEIVRVYGVSTGAGYAIRAWTLCEKSREPSERLAI